MRRNCRLDRKLSSDPSDFPRWKLRRLVRANEENSSRDATLESISRQLAEANERETVLQQVVNIAPRWLTLRSCSYAAQDICCNTLAVTGCICYDPRTIHMYMTPLPRPCPLG
eukprot:scaffold161792_cov26-Tisochrysis_lutea.AAC.2